MSAMPESARSIELLVLDVDGVLTDGSITYAADGSELKTFHVRDGSALVYWRKLNKRVAIITGRRSRALEVRAGELGIDWVRQGVSDKRSAFQSLLEETGVAPSRVAAIGDDLPDLPVLRSCGLPIAVGDACPEVVAIARYVTKARGGRGAVREAVEMLLTAQGLWQTLVASLQA